MIETVVVICGILIVAAASVVTFVLRRRQLDVGYWPPVGAAAGFITAGELSAINGDTWLRSFFIIIGLIIISLISLIKYWSTMRLIEE